MNCANSPFFLAGAALLWGASAALGEVVPTKVVAKDGSGDFRTIQEAIASLPKEPPKGGRWFVRIRPGIYREKLVAPRGTPPVTLMGQDLTSTIITGEDFAETPKPEGGTLGTFASAGTQIFSDDFGAFNVTFQNSHGAGSQAVAVRLAGDRGRFLKCRFLGWQDTLLLEQGRHFFQECFIEGSVDFIFGGATAFFEGCQLHCLASGCIAAPSTPEEQRHGFAFADCRISAEKGVKVLLGRPWKAFGSAVFLRTLALEGIRPEGWDNWNDPAREQTARFAEFPRKGQEGSLAPRVPWARRLTAEEAAKLTPSTVLGGTDQWEPPLFHTPDERLPKIAEEVHDQWEADLKRSAEQMAADKAALAAEVQAAGLPAPIPAPEAEDFKIEKKAPEWFGSEEAQRLAEVIVSFQTPSGGWSKHVAYDQGPRKPGMHWTSQGVKDAWHYVGTFDNRSTTEQMRLLAQVFQATGRTEFRDSFLKGLAYIFDAQYPSGGWPQVYPMSGGYHDAITYNDNAMTLVLGLLQGIAAGAPEFAFVPEKERAAAAAAVAAGVQCILKCQVVQDGRKTVWCAQHDPFFLAPYSARLKEPASLSGAESMEILRFLMRLPNEVPGQREAITEGLAWFERSKLIGWRAVKRDGRNLWEQDPTATEPMWARFYDLHTNQPIFAGAQDGIVYDSFETMARNNVFGYAFFTPKPQELLVKEVPKWRKRVSQ